MKSRCAIILFSTVFVLLSACAVTPDGPVWIGGKPIVIPCSLDSTCVTVKEHNRDVERCHREGKLFGWIGWSGGCMTLEDAMEAKVDCLSREAQTSDEYGWYETWEWHEDWKAGADTDGRLYDFKLDCEREIHGIEK